MIWENIIITSNTFGGAYSFLKEYFTQMSLPTRRCIIYYRNDIKTCFKFVFFFIYTWEMQYNFRSLFYRGKKRFLLFLMNKYIYIYTYILLCSIGYSGRKCTQRTSILETTFTTLWCACSRADHREGYTVATTIIYRAGGEGRCEDWDGECARE